MDCFRLRSFSFGGQVVASMTLSFVMPGLVPGIHVLERTKEDVDGRAKPGHDEGNASKERGCAIVSRSPLCR